MMHILVLSSLYVNSSVTAPNSLTMECTHTVDNHHIP